MPTYETTDNVIAKQSELIQELYSSMDKVLEQNRAYVKEIEGLKATIDKLNASVGILSNTIEILSNAAAANNIKTFGN